jgi:hypothetical protein
MPRASAHFDVAALLTAVAEQDVGLVISTNDADGFRRLIYGHMRAQPSLRCHVYAAPDSKKKFWLLRQPMPDHAELEPA